MFGLSPLAAAALDIRLKGATESELLLAFSTKPLCGSGEAGLEVQNTLAGCKGSTRCN